MVDIHSHILPGVDDGPRTLDESLEMLKLAAASGTTDIVATPHASSEFPYDAANIRKVFNEVSEKAAGIINLHLGCDFHLNFDNLADALQNPERYTINGHRYLMVELPDVVAVHPTREALLQLIRARFIPVITHPERNYSLQAKPDDLGRWVKDGCLVQITAQSFLGSFGSTAKRLAHSLLHAGLVHVVASDGHDCQHRPPVLAKAYNYIASRYGRYAAEVLFLQNPTAALSGDVVAARLGKTSLLRRLGVRLG